MPSAHDLETKTVLKQLNLSIMHNKRKTGSMSKHKKEVSIWQIPDYPI
ncbi:hypothetical protein PRABACTJOHN_00777 [Parabacteroides johnsonii DSM 18315]|uniref:Uncharacterized protein n=1 Tax=Parabacteroides johnsonii DSM 18315 TaxID=537006 RepID=B7B6Y1_9BACT|nr:hypothetical protein PRABACTJOHN_00777 [Parabacteroides johnsonii DSM 18315]